ncbi:hypothetical protein AHMF7605_11770 [Adhaeribacter arboris]|uniref:Uncharacterized protein n=1 Tax=Adhaeribacter arboris TaxID=2072846 RepID=A0A2T2YF60_9BACT|nr:hypothetical protein [Adhaeribacter arboris]PSR54149.1 hypothetical protein AHMF7605_11770 [Adhaeribacter arboris]
MTTYKMEDLDPEEAHLMMLTGLTLAENYQHFQKTKQMTEAAISKALSKISKDDPTKEELESCDRTLRQIIAKHQEFLKRNNATMDWRVSDKIYQEYESWVYFQINLLTPLLDEIKERLK